MDGTHTANILLLGQYVAGNFTIANDGAGGVLVTDPPVRVATDTGRFVVGVSSNWTESAAGLRMG